MWLILFTVVLLLSLKGKIKTNLPINQPFSFGDNTWIKDWQLACCEVDQGTINTFIISCWCLGCHCRFHFNSPSFMNVTLTISLLNIFTYWRANFFPVHFPFGDSYINHFITVHFWQMGGCHTLNIWRRNTLSCGSNWCGAFSLVGCCWCRRPHMSSTNEWLCYWLWLCLNCLKLSLNCWSCCHWLRSSVLYWSMPRHVCCRCCHCFCDEPWWTNCVEMVAGGLQLDAVGHSRTAGDRTWLQVTEMKEYWVKQYNSN